MQNKTPKGIRRNGFDSTYDINNKQLNERKLKSVFLVMSH